MWGPTSTVDARRHDARHVASQGRLHPNLRGFAAVMGGCHLAVVG